MKGSETFTQIIGEYLQSRASTDPLFAATLKKPNKNINDCITYILNTVKASGRNGFADEEIFSMAVHYYDEDDIKLGSTVKNVRIITNRPSETSKAPASPAATRKVEKSKSPSNQISLF